MVCIHSGEYTIVATSKLPVEEYLEGGLLYDKNHFLPAAQGDGRPVSCARTSHRPAGGFAPGRTRSVRPEGMAAGVPSLDAYEQPSDRLRGIWKAYSKTDQEHLLQTVDIDDLALPEKAAEFCQAGAIPSGRLTRCFNDFLRGGGDEYGGDDGSAIHVDHDAPIYYHPLLPGWHPLACSLLPALRI